MYICRKMERFGGPHVLPAFQGVGILIGRTHSAGDRVGAGVEMGGVGPLVGARRASSRTTAHVSLHPRAATRAPTLLHTTPAPTRPIPLLKRTHNKPTHESNPVPQLGASP